MAVLSFTNLNESGFCVFHTILVVISLIGGTDAECPSGWLRTGDFCYWLSTESVSFNDAEGVCATQESSLVSFTTAQDLNTSLAIMTSSGLMAAWIGLRFDYVAQKWMWLDGTGYDASAVPWWNQAEPVLQSHNSVACVILTAQGVVRENSCTSMAALICKRSAYKRELCKEEDGWHAIGTNCYRTFDEKVTWTDAKTICLQHDATLLPSPLNEMLRFVIQQSIVCDTPDNDVWINTPQDQTSTAAPLSQTSLSSIGICNYVSVQFNLLEVQGDCLDERKFICTKLTGTCSIGWVSQEGRCYQFSEGGAPWFLARQACEQQGAQLLVISDESEQQFIQTQMTRGSLSSKAWLGFSDMTVDGVYMWVDGTSAMSSSTSYSNWNQGFYNNTLNVTDCGIIVLGQNGAKWSSGYCFFSHQYVCEMSVSAVLIRNQSSLASCDQGWKLQEQSCYFVGDNRNFTAAQAFCQASGGSLAVIHSPLEESYLAAVIPAISLAWIGLHRDRSDSGQFFWVDNSKVDWTNWLPGEPNDAGSNEECVQIVGAAQMFPGGWNDNNCNQAADFICEKAAVIDSATSSGGAITSPWSVQCGPGWTYSTRTMNCYMWIQDTPRTWPSARADCIRRNADLASITSHLEQTLMEAMMSDSEASQGVIWIGASDNSVEGGWEWSNGAAFRYVNWDAGQPNDIGQEGEEQNCVVMTSTAQFHWDDRNCGEMHSYICKKLAVSPASTTPQSSTDLQASCNGVAVLSGDYSVTDSMLFSSSQIDSQHGAAMSRIFPLNLNAWCAQTDDHQPYIGVHFETEVTVLGVITTGGLTQQAWVSEYKIRYRYDSSSPLYWYSNPPSLNAKVFRANNDSSTPVTNKLDLPFVAREVRLYPSNWTGVTATLHWELLACMENACSPDYAVSGPLIVPDNNITASTVSDPQHGAASVRLNAIAAGMIFSCWRPFLLDTSQWIQVDFDRVKVLHGITTKGNPNAAEWVTTYMLLYIPDQTTETNFQPYEEPYGSVMIFRGNSDNNNTVTNYLKSYMPTQHVRLQPQTWQGYIAVQMDILVCEAGCQEQALINGKVPLSDDHFSASSSYPNHGPQNSHRYNGLLQSIVQLEAKSDGWRPIYNNTDQFIQIDLDVPLEVRSVTTQGCYSCQSWITSYMLQWSSDGTLWNNYMYNNKTVIFSGNFDADTEHKHYLTPFVARFVRLKPLEWSSGGIGLRWELFGCPGVNSMETIGCFVDHPEHRDLPYEPFIEADNGMDPVLCTRHCFTKGYYFAGLQAQELCFCGNSYGHYGVSADCNLKCFPQQTFNCGGMTSNFVYTTGLTSSHKVCSPGWLHFGEECYILLNMSRDWSSARTACQGLNATLASVPDYTTNMLLYSLMGNMPVPMPAWIGLSDQREERYFEWSNLENVVFTAWDLKQPDISRSGENSHCVAINNQTAGWVVEDCGITLPALCMAKPAPTDEPANLTAPDGCQMGMFAYSYSCYVIVEEIRSHDNAVDACKSFGGNLIVINDRYEQAFITSLLSEKSGFYWTDVNDVSNPGQFTYNHGLYTLTFTNWAPNMPASLRQGHCVAMGTGTEAGLWFNKECTTRLKAVCKLPRVGFYQSITPQPQISGPCPVNWISVNTSLCYQLNKVAPTLQLTWLEAREDCHEQRADLASFQDINVMDYFWRQKLLGSSNHFWIGLHTSNNGVFEWVDGTSVVMTHWAAGQPNTQNGTKMCVELQANTGTMSLQDCSLQRNWLCSLSQGLTPFPRLSERIAPTAGPAGSCAPLDDTWKRYRDFCYFVTSESEANGATWRQARLACQNHGADLASIRDIQENNFILSMVSKASQQNVWIGFSELQSDAGYYSWSDGSPMNFINWQDRPDDANGEEACVEMFARTGKWNDNHCALRQGYVCKRNMVITNITTTPVTVIPSSGGCPDGFQPFGDRCYGVFGGLGEKSWQEALTDCRQKSTPFLKVTLAAITSERENAFITTLLHGTGILAWLGLHLVDQQYQWISNDELTYTNWDTHEPNGNNMETCVHMYSLGANAGRWNDALCTRNFGWVCQSNKFAYSNSPTTAISSSCAEGFWSYNSACYRYMAIPHSWKDAEASCVTLGAHLTSVHTKLEQDLVYLIASDPGYTPPIWLGLTASKSSTGTQFGWSDSWPVVYTNWAPNEPSENGDEGCVSMMADGMWSEDNCSNIYTFVCKTTTEFPPYSLASDTGVCLGDAWQPFGSHCYSFFLKESVTFAHASFQCAQIGSDLVSIHDNASNIFLEQIVKANSPLPAWIGLRQAEIDGYAWRDHTALDFTNWASNYPRSVAQDGTETRCVQLSPWNGMWTNENCDTLLGYICLKDKVYATPTQTAMTSSVKGSSAFVSSITPQPQGTSGSKTTSGNTNIPGTALQGSTSQISSSASTSSIVIGTSGNQKGNDAGLGGGSIAGIVIGAVVLCLTLIVIGLLLFRHHRDRLHSAFTRSLYSGQD